MSGQDAWVRNHVASAVEPSFATFRAGVKLLSQKLKKHTLDRDRPSRKKGFVSPKALRLVFEDCVTHHVGALGTKIS